MMLKRVLNPYSILVVLVIILLIHDIPKIFQTNDNDNDLADTPISKTKSVFEKITKKKVQGPSGSKITLIKQNLMILKLDFPDNDIEETFDSVQSDSEENILDHSNEIFEFADDPISSEYLFSCSGIFEYIGIFVLPSFD